MNIIMGKVFITYFPIFYFFNVFNLYEILSRVILSEVHDFILFIYNISRFNTILLFYYFTKLYFIFCDHFVSNKKMYEFQYYTSVYLF